MIPVLLLCCQILCCQILLSVQSSDPYDLGRPADSALGPDPYELLFKRNGAAAEVDLLSRLLGRSDFYQDVRPVLNKSDTIKVNFGLALIQIFELDEVHQTIDLHVYERYLWRDPTLKWDPKEHHGISVLRIPANKIWIPDIVLYNTASDTGGAFQTDFKRQHLTVVSSDGTVLWIPSARVKAACTVDLHMFPFDSQTCNIKYGSWTYDGYKIDPDFYDGLEEFDVSDYIESNEWELTGHPAVKNVKYYPCCEEPYPELVFTLELKRKASFYCTMILVPGGILALLVPAVFLISVGRPEKFILGCAILLGFTVSSFAVDMMIPVRSSGTPLINVFFAAGFMFTSVTLALSALILNISANKKEIPSRYKRWIKLLSETCGLTKSNIPTPMTIPVNAESNTPNMEQEMDPEKKPILDSPRCSAQLSSSNAQAPAPVSDWMILATILDRIFLVLSMVGVIIFALAFILYKFLI